jgi:hypothetical protein
MLRPPPRLPRAPPRQGRLGRASGIRPGYRHLQRIYCTRRDDELVALCLEAMTLPELIAVSSKLLARGAHEEAAELLAWIRWCALDRQSAP